MKPMNRVNLFLPFSSFSTVDYLTFTYDHKSHCMRVVFLFIDSCYSFLIFSFSLFHAYTKMHECLMLYETWRT